MLHASTITPQYSAPSQATSLGTAAQSNQHSSPPPPPRFTGGLHRRPGCQERRQPQTDPAQPAGADLDHGGGGRSLCRLQVVHQIAWGSL